MHSFQRPRKLRKGVLCKIEFKIFQSFLNGGKVKLQSLRFIFGHLLIGIEFATYRWTIQSNIRKNILY